MIVISFIAAVLAGCVRSGVGAGWLPRVIAYPMAGIAVALAGFGVDPLGLAFAAVAVGTLWLGHTKWEDPAYMAARYGLPALVLSLVSGRMARSPRRRRTWTT